MIHKYALFVVRKLQYLTIVGNTAYFFCKQINYLLPIPVTVNCIESIVKIRDFAVPHIHNTFMRTLKAFGTNITEIYIYKHSSDAFLAYIRIKRSETVFDINANFDDCIVFVTSNNIPVTINEKILIEKGFYVSKEMVEKALVGNDIT